MIMIDSRVNISGTWRRLGVAEPFDSHFIQFLLSIIFLLSFWIVLCLIPSEVCLFRCTDKLSLQHLIS